MATYLDEQIPELWDALIEQFGLQADYVLDGGATVPDVPVLLNEGREGEPAAPGRYARLLVHHSDLPRSPQTGDALYLSEQPFDVVSVETTMFSVSRLVVQRAG